MLSVGESLGKGVGAGAGPFFAHWHVRPCERSAPWLQQQDSDPLSPQQLVGRAEDGALLSQHEDCGRVPP